MIHETQEGGAARGRFPNAIDFDEGRIRAALGEGERRLSWTTATLGCAPRRLPELRRHEGGSVGHSRRRCSPPTLVIGG